MKNTPGQQPSHKNGFDGRDRSRRVVWLKRLTMSQLTELCDRRRRRPAHTPGGYNAQSYIERGDALTRDEDLLHEYDEGYGDRYLKNVPATDAESPPEPA